MDITKLIDIFLNLDDYLSVLVSNHNIWAYVFLFLIIFIETGVVILPFLPGDSLLFAAGAIAALPSEPLHIPILLLILYVAAVGGDTLNYEIGRKCREKINKREKIRFIKMEYIEKTQVFFAKHGGKTITIARFIPIIRTFAPFVAGVGQMPYKWFFGYNLIGGLTWVTALFGFGYFFGNIPFIQNHFSLVMIAIILISVSPAVISFIHAKCKKVKSVEAE